MKTVVGLFFLSIFLALPVSAAEVSLHVPGDYKVNHVASVGKALVFTFDFEGNYIVAEDIGMPATRKRAEIVAYKVSKFMPDGTSVTLLERTGQRITNLSYYQGKVYIVTNGRIYKIAKGKIFDVISSLPTYGDYKNSSIIFNNGSMYLAVGTATNSGIVGPDNTWLASYPSIRDVACGSYKLSGVNVETDNFLTEKKDDKAITGSYSTFNTPITQGQIVYGMQKCNGGVLKVNLDGSSVMVYASGIHNPKSLSMDDSGNLWVFDGGMEDRGVRPIKNGKDALYQVSENTWYGWPDFSAGNAVDQPAILADFPNTPPKPVATFDLNQIKNIIVSPETFFFNSGLAQISDDKLSQIDLARGELSEFLSITDGKLLQYKFGPDDKLYVLIDVAGKSELYSIEPTVPLVSSTIETHIAKSSMTNWFLGFMLALVTGAGFFALKNLRRPLPPF